MKTIVDHKNKLVYFQGDWPTNIGIPNYMNANYPEYSHRVLNYENFQRVQNEQKKSI